MGLSAKSWGSDLLEALMIRQLSFLWGISVRIPGQNMLLLPQSAINLPPLRTQRQTSSLRIELLIPLHLNSRRKTLWAMISWPYQLHGFTVWPLFGKNCEGRQSISATVMEIKENDYLWTQPFNSKQRGPSRDCQEFLRHCGETEANAFQASNFHRGGIWSSGYSIPIQIPCWHARRVCKHTGDIGCFQTWYMVQYQLISVSFCH